MEWEDGGVMKKLNKNTQEILIAVMDWGRRLAVQTKADWLSINLDEIREFKIKSTKSTPAPPPSPTIVRTTTSYN